MIEKRRQAWNNKSEFEKNAINEKRHNNSHTGIYVVNKVYEIKELFFYAFQFQNGIKFGVTKQSNIFKRWKKKLIEEVLVFEKFKTNQALLIEQKFKLLPECCYNDIIKTTEFLIMKKETFKQLYEEIKCINLRLIMKHYLTSCQITLIR